VIVLENAENGVDDLLGNGVLGDRGFLFVSRQDAEAQRTPPIPQSWLIPAVARNDFGIQPDIAAQGNLALA